MVPDSLGSGPIGSRKDGSVGKHFNSWKRRGGEPPLRWGSMPRQLTATPALNLGHGVKENVKTPKAEAILAPTSGAFALLESALLESRARRSTPQH